MAGHGWFGYDAFFNTDEHMQESTNLWFNRIGFPIVTEAGLSDESFVVALPLEAGDGTWDGHDLDLDRIWFYGPDSEHEGVGRQGRLGRPPRFATVTIPLAVACRTGLGGDVAERGRKRMVEHVRAAELRTTVVEVLKLAECGSLSAAAAAGARAEIFETIADIGAHSGEASPGERSAASWLVGECLAVADTLGPMPSPADLASALGVSDRWIRAAFQRVFGVSTAKFFRARAIDGARRELRAASPGSASVTEVAMRWGFWHLGRFSATYRSYVGELPSETLCRQP